VYSFDISYLKRHTPPDRVWTHWHQHQWYFDLSRLSLGTSTHMLLALFNAVFGHLFGHHSYGPYETSSWFTY